MNFSPEVIERFKNKIEPITESGCWIWMGTLHSFGYGWFWLNGTVKLAHRISWEIFKGTIPRDKCILHKCDIPYCVNPNHLFLGTRIDNNIDRDKKKRVASGEKQGHAKLTINQVNEIRSLYIPRKMSSYKLAKKYGVSNSNIMKIINKQSWN